MLVRERPWNKFGTEVKALTVAEALEKGGANFPVISQKIYAGDDLIEIPNMYANINGATGEALGIVSNRYRIVQNELAFDFVNELAGMGAQFERVGVIGGGQKVWMLVNLPSYDVLGDTVENNIVFVNTHNGEGALKICITPIRIACSNALNLAFRKADRSWSTRHMGDMELKFQLAREVLLGADRYAEQLKLTAQELVGKRVGEAELRRIVSAVTTDVAKQDELAEHIQGAMRFDDMQNFKGTAWQMLNAVSDVAGHMAPKRMTKTFAQKNFERGVEGNNIIDVAYEILKEVA